MCDGDKQQGSGAWRRGKERTGGEQRDSIGCLHHATREGSVTPRAQFTRMIQHQLIVPHPPSAPSLLPVLMQRAGEITPPEPATLFNDMSGQNVIALLKRQGGGNALSLELRVCVCMCVFAFMCACTCVFVPPVCACAVGCKLQANEWKSGILKALGK